MVAEVFAREGIQVLTGVTISQVSYDDGQFTVVVDDQELTFDKLLVAAGRTPEPRRPRPRDRRPRPRRPAAIEIDERMIAGDGLWAIGDIVGHGAFTHMSMYQSAIAVASILGKDGPTADYRAVPHVTFTDPEVGGVGMTEKQARDAGLNVRVGTHRPRRVDPRLDRQGGGPRQAGRGRRPRRARRAPTSSARPAARSSAMLTTAVHAEVPTRRCGR